ncbi:MAG: membrane dipeptidase, partial [Oscillospiraceae bacterium]|nr:membrane dipeptidase [Oscillospiraceae bacterium]
VCDHIFHFLQVAGSDNHLSLGSDFDGMERLPAGITGIQDYPKLAERLLERGLDEETVYKVFWKNAIEVIERCSI